MAHRRTGLRYPATTLLPNVAVINGRAKSKKEAKATKSLHQKVSIPARLRRLPPQPAGTKKVKITYVLDANVLMADWKSIFNFDEHDVVIDSQVWRELDNNKKGQSDKAFNARRVISAIIKLVDDCSLAPEDMIKSGVPIIPPENLETGKVSEPGRLFLDFSIPKMPDNAQIDLDLNEPDDRILMTCLGLKAEGKKVVLVSRDGNFRVKATFAGVIAEEYLRDAVVENDDSEENLSRGFHELDSDFWNKLTKDIEVTQVGNESRYKLVSPFFQNVSVNEFLLLPDDKKFFVRKKSSSQTVEVETFYSYIRKVFGVKARNPEQECGLKLLMDDKIHAVSLAGQAGSGKTLLALAAGLEQVFVMERFNRIIVTRPNVSAGEEIGFLPGYEDDKMLPWLGSIFDNLDIIPGVKNEKIAESGKGSLGDKALLQRLRIKVNAMAYMKGRTINNSYIIVEEAQDLTRKQIKMLSTRLGPGSKIVFPGNAAQIDNNLLTEHTSGLSVFIRTFRETGLSGHITLQSGERHPFATLAEDLL